MSDKKRKRTEENLRQKSDIAGYNGFYFIGAKSNEVKCAKCGKTPCSLVDRVRVNSKLNCDIVRCQNCQRVFDVYYWLIN